MSWARNLLINFDDSFLLWSTWFVDNIVILFIFIFSFCVHLIFCLSNGSYTVGSCFDKGAELSSYTLWRHIVFFFSTSTNCRAKAVLSHYIHRRKNFESLKFSRIQFWTNLSAYYLLLVICTTSEGVECENRAHLVPCCIQKYNSCHV